MEQLTKYTTNTELTHCNLGRSRLARASLAPSPPPSGSATPLPLERDTPNYMYMHVFLNIILRKSNSSNNYVPTRSLSRGAPTASDPKRRIRRTTCLSGLRMTLNNVLVGSPFSDPQGRTLRAAASRDSQICGNRGRSCPECPSNDQILQYLNGLMDETPPCHSGFTTAYG